MDAFCPSYHSSPGTINTKLFHYLSLAFYVVSLTAANANLCGTTGCILRNPSHVPEGDYEGQIIVMSTKDSDNKLVMAAFAVVDVENAAGYAYLFREAKTNPDMAAFLNSPDTTIYADGHLRTPAAKEKELPLWQLGNCVKHLIGSLRKA